ncbi:lytic murein transglycosylase B [Seongchinamella sediminis]|uniref:Lytic murein transglycosylase B n=1 Tax=Seongchinamella sediminis TaxID=2283635 RepID=A0A3L7DUI6_9GAMM|nr:lytic murein transglycosylase B [Seongchinamella sediminis]RLQ21247.1 lytic murein transglycosylase B [Seongchinamella sediminis]
MHKFLSRSLLACTCLWSAISCAEDQNYLANPAAVVVMDELVSEEGFDRQSLEAIFAAAYRQQSILDAMSRPAEKTKAWYEYREIFINDKRIDQGVDFYREHRDTLERAERETGVPAAIIVAIIGVETYYGRIAGSYRVIDALTTLAFDYPRRSEFFTGELKHYLILTRDQGMDPLALKGSYAGAMGYGQFMPSSYRSYAIDFDSDDKADIWNNPVDAIGSVANYFKAHGWTPGAEVVVAARTAGEVPEEMMSRGRQLKPRFTVAEFAAAGLVPVSDADPAAEAIGIEFELADGMEYWLGLHNFYVITRYNHSAMYAMSVYQLSQHIAAGVAE